MDSLLDRLQAALGDSYEVERELGGGGMSRVYLAEERALGRRVVVKVLPPELSAGVNADRFRREIRVVAQLQHPHIVPVLHAGESGDLLYYTMPYVEGDSLRARLAREGPLPVDDVRRILGEVLDALVSAHAHGVVHRDIKPDNVLISGQHAVVTDFGVAKALSEAAAPGTITSAGVAFGTPAYMAPEQVTADPSIDHRADLYSVGALAYEMLTGRPPFTGTSQAVLAAQITEPPIPVTTRRTSVPPELAALVMRCLEKLPADRPQSAERLLRDLESISSASLRPATGEDAGVRTPRTLRRRRLITVLAASGALFVIVAAVVASAMRRSQRGDDAIRSVAVLPFVNVGGDSADEYFSDGMTDELTNALAKIPDLKVTSRTSAFLFKKRQDLDIRQIGEKLKVAAVIEGTVYRTGPRLRIHAQLTKVADNFALWSDRYDRAISSAEDVFGMQDDIAKSIAAALRVHLTGGSASLAERGTADLEAYNLYLQGRYAWNQRTTASVTRAVRYFEQAAARDDRFARAYAGLAAAYVVLPFFAPVSSRDAWPKVKTAADRALALDPNLAEALAARAYGAFMFERDYRAAEAGFRQAIAADPRNPTAHHWFADMLGGRGALDGRLHELKVAQELDPLYRIVSMEIGQTLAALGQVDEAIAELRGTIDMDDSFASGHCQLGTLYVMKGMPTEGIREIQRALQLNGDRQASFVAYLASAYAASGQLDSARALIDELNARAKREYVPAVAFAIAFAGLGDKDTAFGWLDKAIENHEGILAEAWFDPSFESLHSDPRWAGVLARLGVVIKH